MYVLYMPIVAVRLLFLRLIQDGVLKDQNVTLGQ